MNKDLYIQLLEEHVDDLTTAAKIDTVLSLRKTEKIKEFKSELVSVNDWNKAQDELISKIADTAMDYQDDINDLQADWAADRTGLTKIIKGYESDQVLAEDITGKLSENKKLREINRELKEERDRFRGIIKELKKEKYDMGMELEKLKKQNKNLKMYNENLIEDLETSRKRLRTEAQR